MGLKSCLSMHHSSSSADIQYNIQWPGYVVVSPSIVHVTKCFVISTSFYTSYIEYPEYWNRVIFILLHVCIFMNIQNFIVLYLPEVSLYIYPHYLFTVLPTWFYCPPGYFYVAPSDYVSTMFPTYSIISWIWILCMFRFIFMFITNGLIL